jgi:co-chaperonin GroES (HSP10)
MCQFVDISADGTEICRGGIWVPIHTGMQAWRVGKVLLAGPRAKVKVGQHVIFPSTFGLKANNINNLKHIVFLNEDRIFGVAEPE